MGVLALVGVALAFALAGCSSSSLLGSESPADTVRTYLEAAAAHDGPAACRLLNGHGQRVIGVYPARFGDPGAHERSCQQTVSRLGRLPHADDWEAMARGRICVYGSAGRDSRAIVVIYTRRGTRATALGSVQPNLGAGFRVMVPPTPVRAEVAAASPSLAGARCSPAAT